MSSTTRSEIRHLLSLAAPVTLAFLANMLMQVVDTLFVGRLGPQAIGGVSIGNSLFVTMMVVGMGAILGLDFLVSHSYGARKLKDCHVSLIQAIYLSIAVSAVFGAIMVFLAFHLDWFGIDPTLLVGSRHYVIIIAVSLFPFLLFSCFRQYLQAMGVAAPILWILLLSNGVNVLGNYVLVWGRLGFRSYGVEGSACSTVIARTFMFLTALGYVLWRDHKKKLGLLRAPFGFSPKRSYELLRLGLPAAGQMLLEVGVFSFVTLLVGRLGAQVLSAHQIVLHIASTAFMVPLGLSIASAVRIGQSLGADEYHRAARIGWLSLVIAASWMCFSGAMLFLFSNALVSSFSQDAQVLSISKSLILIVALFQISDGMQVTLTGVLRGIADTKSPMYANLIGHWVLGLPIGALLCFKLGWGAKGLWVGLWIGLSFVALTLLIVWKMKSRKIDQSKHLTERQLLHPA